MPHSELYHHGIKGMKWGRRRYQNADGSYTPEGKTRYSRTNEAEKELAKRRSDYDKLAERNASFKKLNDQNRLIDNSKTVLKNAKTLDDIDAKGLSKSAKKYEKQYLDKGYSKEDAKIAAYNRD